MSPSESVPRPVLSADQVLVHTCQSCTSHSSERLNIQQDLFVMYIPGVPRFHPAPEAQHLTPAVVNQLDYICEDPLHTAYIMSI